MRGVGGGRPCPNFLSIFHKLYILGQFWDGEGGGDPCPIFLAHRRSKKEVQVVQIRGRGQGNLDKIQKNSYFFLETVPNRQTFGGTENLRIRHRTGKKSDKTHLLESSH